MRRAPPGISLKETHTAPFGAVLTGSTGDLIFAIERNLLVSREDGLRLRHLDPARIQCS